MSDYVDEPLPDEEVPAEEEAVEEVPATVEEPAEGS